MSYDSIHGRLRSEQGPASSHVCPCGEPARDWAYQHTGDTLIDDKGRHYTNDLVDYLPLCRSCHRQRDLEMQENVRESARSNGRLVGARRVQWAIEHPEEARALRSRAGSARAKAMWERYRSDPEFHERLNEAARKNAVLAREALAAKRKAAEE